MDCSSVPRPATLCIVAALACASTSFAADTVFSGPQPGEKTSPFQVLSVSSGSEPVERDPIAENKGKPIVIVFLHAIERSLVPLLRVVDEYSELRKDKLASEIIFLTDDKIAGEQRMKAVASSLRLKSRLGLSPDGAEGPGNYGLNKECMMTIVVANENKVTANFALVQPGIADAPKIIEALAHVSGDQDPPKPETLLQRGPAPGMRPAAARQPRDARTNQFPGAVPTDEKLVSLLRQFIRPANDDATVDRLLKEVAAYIKDSPDLKKQAIDGWTRVLHFEQYGTPYARQAGASFLERLKASDNAVRN